MSNVVIEAPDPTTARDFSRFSCRRFDTVDSRMTSRSGRPCLPALLAVTELAHRPRCEPSPINLQGVIHRSRREYRHQPAAGPLNGPLSQRDRRPRGQRFPVPGRGDLTDRTPDES
jgi:hypothetical protein